MISLTSPVETAAHGWPAGVKLGLLAAATVALFAAPHWGWSALGFAGMLALYALPGRLFMRSGLGRLWGLWPFVVIIGVWHLVIRDPAGGALIVLRMITAVGLANLVTMTTSLRDMTALLERLLAPLDRLGVPVQNVPLAMALVVRFVPVLALKGETLTAAWRARSPRKPGWRIILPFAVTAIDDAEQVAEALRARGGL